jgi:aminoglycoside phosphotransferase (APT) family kinase protein
MSDLPATGDTLPQLDEALVQRLLAAQFPQWSGLPVRKVRPGGWDNRTFRLGDELAVRLPSAHRYVAAVEKEQHWLPRLAPQLPLPIPAPVARGEPGEGYPFPWSVNRWLAGEPPTAGTLAQAGDEGVAFACQLAGFLRALQAIDAADGPAAGAHNFHRGGDIAVYDAQAREAIDRLAGQLDAGLARAAWERARGSRWHRAPVWIHGDVAATNLLVQDGRLCAVIDFGTCGTGDPACDLVIAWTFLPPPAAAAFRDALALDDDTWARARGWALWKAAIMLSGVSPGPHDPAHTRSVLHRVLAEHAASA